MRGRLVMIAFLRVTLSLSSGERDEGELRIADRWSGMRREAEDSTAFWSKSKPPFSFPSSSCLIVCATRRLPVSLILSAEQAR